MTAMLRFRAVATAIPTKAPTSSLSCAQAPSAAAGRRRPRQPSRWQTATAEAAGTRLQAREHQQQRYRRAASLFRSTRGRFASVARPVATVTSAAAVLVADGSWAVGARERAKLPPRLRCRRARAAAPTSLPASQPLAPPPKMRLPWGRRRFFRRATALTLPRLEVAADARAGCLRRPRWRRHTSCHRRRSSIRSVRSMRRRHSSHRQSRDRRASPRLRSARLSCPPRTSLPLPRRLCH